MVPIDYEMKRPLMEQLDKCLLDHVVAAGSKEGGPDIVDAYKLQGLSEVHYYLKVEHDFTLAEVQALMQFTDPLEVAAMCWEERNPKVQFSICDMLIQINAYEHYPLTAAAEHSQERMVAAVKSVLDQDMREYRDVLLGMDRRELIEKSAEIAVMREAFDFMMNDFAYQRGDAEALLRMENPLRFVAGQWPSRISEVFDMNDLVGEAIGAAARADMPQRDEKASVEKDTAHVQEEKPSIRGQLRDAARDTGQSHPPETKAKGGDAR